MTPAQATQTTLTTRKISGDKAWKQVYRAMSYLVSRYGHAEDAAIGKLAEAIDSIRGEMCAS